MGARKYRTVSGWMATLYNAEALRGFQYSYAKIRVTHGPCL